jgi:hypothetical protein
MNKIRLTNYLFATGAGLFGFSVRPAFNDLDPSIDLACSASAFLLLVAAVLLQRRNG